MYDERKLLATSFLVSGDANSTNLCQAEFLCRHNYDLPSSSVTTTRLMPPLTS